MIKQRYYKKFQYLLIILLLIPSACFALPYAQQANQTIKSIFKFSEHPYLSQASYSNYKKIADELYFFSPTSLIWLDPNDLDKKRITDALQLLSTAKQNGLNEEHYNLSNLRINYQRLKNQKDQTIHDLALLDTAISISVIHFLSDLHFGRIEPVALNYHFKKNPDSINFIPLILNAIQHDNINQLALQVEPKYPAYRYLKAALSYYRKLNNTRIIPSHIDYQYAIHPGDINPQIAKIRIRLEQLGISVEPSLSYLYDDALVDKIIAYQKRHGLMSDGIIGKKTIKSLNTPLSTRIQQIEFALERFRWLPKTNSNALILVNIPSFQLWALNTSEANMSPIISMKVIVGQSKKWKSPVFLADMYYLEFSPYWNVPDSITDKEILPKLAENPLYLEQQNMELVSGFHNDELPIPFTEDSIEQLKQGELKLRQRPGKKNALGRVKFIFPNNFNVYLHDTPAQRLFNKPRRDLSHGCIRVEKPLELANFLLQSKPGWDYSKISEVMDQTIPQQIRLASAIPVVIFYSTALADADKIFFFDDIYQYDKKLKIALESHHNKQKWNPSSLLSSN